MLLCKDGDGPSCLTAPQVEAAAQDLFPREESAHRQGNFSGAGTGKRTGLGHPLWTATDVVRHGRFQIRHFNNPNWDYHTLDLDSDVATADKVDDGSTSAMDPNLKDFFGRGGKLLMYHGWTDPNISPLNTMHYYESVLKTMGGAASGFDPPVHVSGMGHCGGGEGPNTFNAIGALAQWVEKGQAPEQMLASHRASGAWTARVRYAPIRRSPHTKAPAAPTTPRTLSANPHEGSTGSMQRQSPAR